MNDWQTKRLGDVIKLNYGKSLSVKNRSEGAIPVYGSNGIVGSHNEAIVDMPGIIIGRKGSAGQVHRSLGPFCPIDTTFYITAADAPDTDIDFLFYLLRHIDLTRITGDVGVPGLNREMAYMEPAHFPPTLPEQKKIAYVLSTVERAIEQQERIIQATTELKKALMHKLFAEGLRKESQKETEIGLIPESWEVCRIGDVYEITKKPRGLDITKNGNMVPFFTMSDVPAGSILTSGYTEKSADNLGSGTYVENEDLIVAKITPSFENGKQAIVDVHTDFAYATTEVIPLRGKADKASNRYLFFYLLLADVRSDLTGKMEGSTGRQRLSKIVLQERLMPLPSIAQQEEIAEILAVLQRKIETAESKIDVLQALFRTLLHELMTAKIRVNDIDFDDIEAFDTVQ